MARTRAGRPVDSRRPGLRPFQSAQGSAGLSVRKSVFEQTSGSRELKFGKWYSLNFPFIQPIYKSSSAPAIRLGCAEGKAELKSRKAALCTLLSLLPEEQSQTLRGPLQARAVDCGKNDCRKDDCRRN